MMIADDLAFHHRQMAELNNLNHHLEKRLQKANSENIEVILKINELKICNQELREKIATLEAQKGNIEEIENHIEKWSQFHDAKKVIQESAEKLSDISINSRSDMRDNQQRFALEALKLAIIDPANITYQDLAHSVVKQMKTTYRGNWVCFVGSRYRMFNGCHSFHPGSNLDCCVALLSMLLFIP